MRGLAKVSLAACALFALAGTAAADGPFGFFHNLGRDWHRSNCWPQPFVCPDRVSVQQPFGVMIQKGWQRENLIGAYYFNENDELTEAGKLRVQWILTQAPASFRTIFVQRDFMDAGVTQKRTAAVEQMASRILPPGQPADVVLSDLAPEGRPADEVDRVFVRYQEASPPPVLPQNSSLDGSGISQ